ncbi:MAG: acetyl-CoA carboxylase biotin carboxylase subunit [Candidatus Eisenbacteria bacterium]|uniref:Biotin carboxylase n=1 Tax=Eiseniibacteriota bacterium TaxID=2212470 RepID=A0A937XE00_UNCEI|nr:acetyl-CoA carboxylase biotin carboxylase subunit [Candidatus Eisenbacteria bacterium]
MFRKILVANRGEIAVRVIRAAHELGIATVAAYSDADRESLAVKLADEAICIGPAPSKSSYLNISSIISACQIADADALHPGYGFLSENHRFAEACGETGIVFIGPPAEAIRCMGDKSAAKAAMRAAGVPVTPGSEGVVGSVDEALAVAADLGYPVLLKAREGGGGKGMRVVAEPEGLASAFEMASAEALASFGNADLYLEKYILRPRHIEIQLAGDAAGRVVHFGERDCSVQRRHQKLVEEAPSPAMTEALRRELGEAAVRGAAGIGYRSLGTMEFLLDAEGHAYFMEMNTRLQVEHGVTEEVTGIDLVKLQILLALGHGLPMRQEEIRLSGHAIECRINAEDPLRDFRPSPGEVTYFYPPGGPGVRVDTHVYPGYVIPPFYDSLLAKIIATERTRDAALARMRRALDELVVEGVATTAPFHRQVLEDPVFRGGAYDTGLAEQVVAALIERERGAGPQAARADRAPAV